MKCQLRTTNTVLVVRNWHSIEHHINQQQPQRASQYLREYIF